MPPVPGEKSKQNGIAALVSGLPPRKILRGGWQPSGMGPDLRDGSRPSGQSVLPELVPEAALADAELLGRSALDVVRLCERTQDDLAFDPVQSLVEADARWLVRRGHPGSLQIEMTGPEAVASTQDHRALDHVLELADVPRPGIVLEQSERLFRDLGNASRSAAAELPQKV